MLGTPDTLLLERSDTMPNNNLYIGERYICLFADPVEWDSTRAYEHLTIVMHEGEGYTSRYAVPPGIDITNEKYWVKTFPRSPKILEIEALIESIKTELSQQADEIAYIKEQIKRLGDIDALEERMSVAEQEIDDIQAVDNRQNERLTDLEEDMQRHEGEYDDIKQKVEQNTDDINAIKLEQQEQNSRLEAVEQVNQQQDTRLTNIEAKDTAQDTEIANIKTEQQTQNSRLEAVEQRNTQQDEILADLEEKDTEQDNRLTAIEQKNTAQDTEIAAIKQEQTVQNSDITLLKQEQTIQNTDISNLKTLTTEQTKDINKNATNITRINETLVNISERQNNIEDRQNNQEVELNAIGNEITAIETTQVNQGILINQNSNEITDIHGDVTNLQNSLSATDLNVATLTENLTQTNTKVTTIEGQIEEINERLENVPGEITELTAQVNSNTQEIQKNDTDILALQTKTATHDTQIGTLQNDVDTVEEKNTEQDNRLTAIEQKDTEQDTAIAAIQTKNTEQDTAIAAIQTKNTEQDSAIQANTTKNTELETELDGQKVIVDDLTDDYQSLSQQVSGVISKVDTNTQDIASIMQQLQRSKYVYNILDYGAVGDNVTDNRAAFNRFFQETKELAKNQYVSLVIPYGKYKINGQITYSGKYYIYGISQPQLIITSGTGAPNLYIGDTTITRGGLFNINFSGDGNTEYLTVTNANDFIIYNCRFDTPSNAIVLTDDVAACAHIKILNLIFSNRVRTAIISNNTKRHANILIENNTCHAGCDTFMNMTATDDINITNSRISCVTGILLNDCNFSKIENNNIWIINNGITVRSSRFVGVVNNSITNADSKVGPNILCESNYHTVINGNSLYTKYQGIVLNRCDRTHIVSNTIGNYTTLDTDSAGILITQGYAYLISQNIISNLNYGMSISKGQVLNGLIITSNMIFQVNTGLEMQSGILYGVNENNVIVVR